MHSYNSVYIPGYTGFIPKIQSVIGETYGNATRKLLVQQAKLLRLSHTAASVSGQRYPLKKRFGQPYGHQYTQVAQDGNATYEYLPTSGHHFAQRLTYDGDPRTTSAIQSIEKIKADLKTPPKPSGTRQLTLTKSDDETMKIPSSRPSLPSDKTFSKKTLNTAISTTNDVPNPEGIQTLAPQTRYANQKRQGKLIYRPDCGLLPNYTGYIPGHKFSFGKTWGKSTRASLQTGKRRPFVWTSVI